MKEGQEMELPPESRKRSATTSNGTIANRSRDNNHGTIIRNFLRRPSIGQDNRKSEPKSEQDNRKSEPEAPGNAIERAILRNHQSFLVESTITNRNPGQPGSIEIK
jgi:hypothetical protein